MKVLGVDPGSKTWDFYALKNDKIILDTSIPSKELIQEPKKAITIIKSVENIDLMVAPSGFGLPLKKVSDLTEKDIWSIYRKEYGDEPFIRIVKEKKGLFRYPEPKILIGTNYCDIGFEKDERSNWLVTMAAIDNLMKGAAGNGIQAMNVMCGFDETRGLEFPGLHPI